MKISECTLSKEIQDLLYRYFAAAANLYGVIEIGKLLKIYNSQNEPVSEEDFLSFVENMNFKGKYFCVLLYFHYSSICSPQNDFELSL